MALAVAGLLAVAAAPPADGAQPAPRCRVPARARVQARTARAVLFTAEFRSRRSGRSFAFEGCVEGVGKRVLIEGGAVTRARLNGYRVAYVVRSAGDYAHDASVRTLDLRRPKRRFLAGVVYADSTPGVPRLSLTRDGAVAYTIDWTWHGVRHREVRVRDRDGLETVDRGADVDVRSLARRGRRVAWTHAGERRTARLARMDRFGACRLRPGADMRARDRRTFVYTADREDRYGFGRTDAYACDIHTGDQQRFAEADHDINDDEFEDDFRVAGRFVAWSVRAYDHYGVEGAFIEVSDLSGRRGRGYDVFLGGRNGDAEVGPPTSVESLLLTRAGDIAWSVHAYNYGFADDYGDVYPAVPRPTIAAHDQFGTVQLDEGRGVDLRSLRLAHAHAVWRHGGAVRSARLWATGRRAPCELPAGARVGNRRIRAIVYRYPLAAGRRAPRRVEACFLPTGRRTRLADTRRGGTRVRHLRLAHGYAAYGVETRRPHRLAVHAVNLRTGTRKWSSVAARAPQDGTTLRLPNLVVAPNGAFAYIVSGSGSPGATTRVRARWSGGDQTLDTGDDVQEAPLEFDGRVVSWYHGSERRERVLR